MILLAGSVGFFCAPATIACCCAFGCASKTLITDAGSGLVASVSLTVGGLIGCAIATPRGFAPVVRARGATCGRAVIETPRGFAPVLMFAFGGGFGGGGRTPPRRFVPLTGIGRAVGFGAGGSLIPAPPPPDPIAGIRQLPKPFLAVRISSWTIAVREDVSDGFPGDF